MTFCVEPGHTCPYGWTDPTDAMRFQKLRSRREDTGVPCTVEEESQIEFDQNECDCCDRDRRAYPESLYASNEVNHCHDADYDCNGKTEELACCNDGHIDLYDRQEPPMRTLWYSSTCREVETTCGGCQSTESSGPLLELGWACVDSCVDDEYNVDDVKRTSDGCPEVCGGQCACVDAQSPPILGECAKFVADCLEVRTNLYSDVEQCCVVAIT